MTKNKNQSIQTLLYWGGGVILTLVIVFFYATNLLEKEENALHQLQLDIATSSQQMLMMRRHEKDFLARQDDKYIEKMEQEANAIRQQLHNINANLEAHKLNANYDSENTLNAIDAYVSQFNRLTNTVFQIYGTDNNNIGYIDELKQATLDFERRAFTVNDEALTYQLIDTQELLIAFFKDFDTRLLNDIDRSLLVLEQTIQRHSNNEALQNEFMAFSSNYYQLRGGFETLGYTHNLGQLGDLRSTIHRVEANLNTLYNLIPILIKKELSSYHMYSYLLAGLLCIAIIMVLMFVIRAIGQLETALISSKEKETRANRAKSSFLANMSHEIRTPLNGIIGMTEILSDSKLSAIQKDYLTTINASSQTLLMLINDVLDLSKIESGNLEVNAHTCDLKEIIYDTAALIAAKAQQKQVDIVVNLEGHIPDYVRADEQKVRQVLMNLASNAIKFTQTGSVTFSLHAGEENEQLQEFFFSVKDTGIGIEKSKHAQVFEEFKQESSSTSANFGGTGLGLAISSKMIKMMGGKIEIESAKGEGCEFYFTIQLAKDPETRSRKSVSKSLVYCSPNADQLLVQNLKTFGYPFDIVASPDEISPELNKDTVIVLDTRFYGDKVEALHHKYPEIPILVARNNNSEKPDYGDCTAGYITLPLLGNRLDTLIKSAKVHDEDQDVNTDIELVANETKDGLVLIVEDNVVNQKVVSVNLKRLGYQFEIANNGQEAVEKYKANHRETSLILMDCMMPIMDGFEATTKIREYEQNEQLGSTHIIALTASILDDDIQRCFDSGMDDYLPKPFRREVLIEKLEKHAVCEA